MNESRGTDHAGAASLSFLSSEVTSLAFPSVPFGWLLDSSDVLDFDLFRCFCDCRTLEFHQRAALGGLVPKLKTRHSYSINRENIMRSTVDISDSNAQIGWIMYKGF